MYLGLERTAGYRVHSKVSRQKNPIEQEGLKMYFVTTLPQTSHLSFMDPATTCFVLCII